MKKILYFLFGWLIKGYANISFLDELICLAELLILALLVDTIIKLIDKGDK